MKTWAWVWLGGLALLGWAPGLALAYFIGLALALGAGWNGALAFGLTYFGLLAVAVLMLVQVRKHFGLTGTQQTWFTWAGGGALVLVWAGAYVGFGVQAGWF